MHSLLGLDRLALRSARDLSARSPRADYTVGQLPLINAVLPTDLVPVYRNGQTYAVPAVLLATATLPNPQYGVATVPADGLNSSPATAVIFGAAYPTACLGVVPVAIYGGSFVYTLVPNIGAFTQTGFTVVVSGNPNAFSTCSLGWLAWGN